MFKGLFYVAILGSVSLAITVAMILEIRRRDRMRVYVTELEQDDEDERLWDEMMGAFLGSFDGDEPITPLDLYEDRWPSAMWNNMDHLARIEEYEARADDE